MRIYKNVSDNIKEYFEYFIGFPDIDEIRSTFDVRKILISCGGHKMTDYIGIQWNKLLMMFLIQKKSRLSKTERFDQKIVEICF